MLFSTASFCVAVIRALRNTDNTTIAHTSREQSSRQSRELYFQNLLKCLAGGALILIEGVGVDVESR